MPAPTSSLSAVPKPSDSPALTLRRRVLEDGPPDGAEGVERLARETGLPAASVRAALSFYDDLHSDPAAVRVCVGTSCQLAGAAPLLRRLEAETRCRGVYCLGHCHRSPAVLRPDGRVVDGCAGLDVADILGDAPARGEPVSVRCLAPEAVITERLARGAGGLEQARGLGVYQGLERALAGPPEAVIDAVEASGEQGRGGAAFPTGRKWRLCAEARADAKYVIANGDEGDPGSYVDRLLLERDPHAVLEGLLLCAYAVGASEAVVFVRSEYPAARAAVERAVAEARDAGLVGPSILGSDFACDVTVFPAMGSYVCGEETALIQAVEGARGEVRLRPPYPVEAGLWGRPTVVQNVETLVGTAWIVRRGPEAYARLGSGASPGTKVMCLNHGFARPGLVEVEMGTPLRAVLDDADPGDAKRSADGRPLAAVIVGGPMGSLVFPEDWDVPLGYAEMRRRGLELGHGGLVAVPEGTNPRRLLEHWLEFMVHESCGKCVPCRVGSKRALETARRATGLDAEERAGFRRLLEVVGRTSLCAFGRLVPRPVLQVLDRWGPEIFDDDGGEDTP